MANSTHFPRTVVVGGSAGSLSAIHDLFLSLPEQSELAFVVIQHMSAKVESHLHSLIAKWTRMSVEPAIDGVQIEANRVYVALPGNLLSVVSGRFQLIAVDSPSGHLLPIDHFCKSLSAEFKSKSALVLLSGSGKDGTDGSFAVRQAGGIVIVQDPTTTNYNSMPLSVMSAGIANCALPPDQIWTALGSWKLPGKMTLTDADQNSVPDDGKMVDDILELVRVHTHKDMRGYKPTTLRRRIERRMGLCNLRSLDAYAKFLQQNSVELERLSKDLFIGVTAFFRDAEAFQILEDEVIPLLCKAKSEGQSIRIWLAGCSTGEEVYSIAILFLECFAKLKHSPELKIFATDIDDAALEVARMGSYSGEALSRVSADRVQRFFVQDKNGLRINKSVRERIVFAHHNLISDPPFSKLDLVVCRNLLIYLNTQTQRKLLSLFHFVLNTGGYLFLGSSENIGSVSRHFDAISKPHRIFRHLDMAPRRPPQLPIHAGLSVRPPDPQVLVHEAGTASGRERIYRQMLDRYAPFQVLANSNYEVLFTSGDSSPYLSVATGQASHDLFKMTKPNLILPLRSAMNRTQREHTRTVVNALLNKQKGKMPERVIRIEVTPIPTPDQQDMMLVCFSLDTAVKTDLQLDPSGGSDWALRQLEQEVDAIREDLQRTIESSRMSNEELKAANEEVMAMNEELQSANEELESSKEELQSLNEELTTTNTNLDAKIMESDVLNNDLANLLTSADTATLLLDENLQIRRFTPACAKLMRVIPSDIGRAFDDLVWRFDDPELSADCRRVMHDLAVDDREITDSENQWYLRRVLPYRDTAGTVAGVVVTFPNVTSLRQAISELKNSEAKFHTMVDWTYDWEYWMQLDGKFRYMTPSVERITGYSASEFDKDPNLIHTIIFAQDLDHWKSYFRSISSEMAATQVAELEYRIVRKTGEIVWIHHSSRQVIDEAGNRHGLRVTARDITEQKVAEEEIRNLAYFDSLTHLPNRRLLLDRLEHALASSVRNRMYGALIMLDLDHFKVLNDTQGHDVGDRLLVEVSGRLLASVRQQDTVARLGGDEFVVMLEGLGRTEKTAARKVEAVAEKIRASLNLPCTLNGADQIYYTTPSIGVTLFQGLTSKVDILLKQADVALYQSKDAGRNAIRFFNPAMQAEIDARALMEGDLRRGLEQGEFELYYQPQVNQHGDVIGAEALLRWNSPTGMVSPDQFIQLAEETGLIVSIGRWVLEAACKQLKIWDANPDTKDIQLSINVSARQFHEPEFVDQVEQCLQNSGANPSKLKLELTESSLLANVNEVITRMHKLNRLGVTFSLDDFGTGYSSLSHLKQLPLDQVKIDQSFIRDLTTDPNDAAIVRAILAMSDSLGIEVIAEGVESEAQCEFLRENGCIAFQGYLFGRPMSIEKWNGSFGASVPCISKPPQDHSLPD